LFDAGNDVIGLEVLVGRAQKPAARAPMLRAK
jgi:hypothetical protein